MNKHLMALAALASLSLVPMASAEVFATFVGTESCSSQTKTCTYSYSGLHGTDAIDVPDAGIGNFYLNGVPWGACTFATLVTCISGNDSGTVTDTFCPWTLYITSESYLLGGSADDTKIPCYSS